MEDYYLSMDKGCSSIRKETGGKTTHVFNEDKRINLNIALCMAHKQL